VLFLLFAALWAQFGFFNLMLSPTASGPCQALLIFTTMFDQLARVGVEQFFVWALGQGTKATTQQMILQGLLGVRLVAGGVLVGFTRPDFAPTCVARTSVMPTSIVVLALDVVIIGVLMIRASSQGVFSEMGDKRSSTRQLQSRALIFSIAGFTVWTGVGCGMARSQFLLTFLSDERPYASWDPDDYLDPQNHPTCERPSHTCW
jgi:hypothetical protein